MMSLFLFPFFYGGDQEYYRAFYDGVQFLSLKDAFYFYKKTLGTSEPGYFLMVYFLSSFLEKDLLFSLINFLFSYLVFYWMIVNKVNNFIVVSVLCNFYFLVLLFSAERLKFALFLLLIGFLLSGFFRYVFFGISVLSHVQLLLIFASSQAKNFIYSIKRLVVGYVAFEFLVIVVSLFLGSIVCAFLWEHIYNKFIVYNKVFGGLDSLIKPSVFMLLSVYYAKGRWLQAFFASLPMVIASVLIGAERVVIFSYFVFMFYSLQYKRGVNVPTIVISSYFSFKGAVFAYNMVNFGDGFLFR